jgi:hypothetical protein
MRFELDFLCGSQQVDLPDVFGNSCNESAENSVSAGSSTSSTCAPKRAASSASGCHFLVVPAV